ncbi:MAG TPA: hypothetical protein VGC76_01155 [Pyrinomonadaceae bacterium]
MHGSKNRWRRDISPPSAIFLNDDEKRAGKIKGALETARAYIRGNSTGRLFALYDRIYKDFRPSSRAVRLRAGK